MCRYWILRFALILTIAALSLLCAQRAHAVMYDEHLGTYAAGDIISSDSEFLMGEESYYYVIDFSDDVLLSGTLTGPIADFDFFIYETTVTGGDATIGSTLFSDETLGNESFSDVFLPAEDYLLEVLNFFSGDDDTYTLTLSTTAVPEPAPTVIMAFILCGLALCTRER
jgi:hypothetical protein